MGRGGSNPPSDTTKLPPPGQSDLFERDVQPWRAAHRDLQVIRVHGDGLEQLINEDAALQVGGLGQSRSTSISRRMRATSSNLAATSDSRLRSTWRSSCSRRTAWIWPLSRASSSAKSSAPNLSA